MLNEMVLAVAHYLLLQAQWARMRLAEHAGKQIRLELPLAIVVLRIAADGDLEPAEPDDPADLVIKLSPLAVAKWPIDRQAAWREARIEGDMELAQATSYVMANLRWDYEDDLSRVVGDVAAHRIARAVRHLAAWPAEAGESLARSAAEYFSEERHVLATPLSVEEFAEQVDQLRDAVERLDKRIERLAQREAQAPPH